MFQTISITASLPGAFSDFKNSKLPKKEIVVRLIDDPVLVLSSDWTKTKQSHLSFTVLVQNRTDNLLIEEVYSLWISLWIPEANIQQEIRRLPYAELTSGRITKAVIVEPKRAELLSFSMPLKLDQDLHDGLVKNSPQLREQDNDTFAESTFKLMLRVNNWAHEEKRIDTRGQVVIQFEN